MHMTAQNIITLAILPPAAVEDRQRNDCGGVDGHVPGEMGAGGLTPACNSRYQARPAHS